MWARWGCSAAVWWGGLHPERHSLTSLKLLPWIPQTAWTAPGWGWNSQESLVNPGQSATAGKSWAHPCYSHSFVVRFGCALQEQLLPHGAINSAALCWHQTKRLPETHRWVVDAYPPGSARNHDPETFLFTARVKYAHIVILGNPFGQVCLT